MIIKIPIDDQSGNNLVSDSISHSYKDEFDDEEENTFLKFL